MKNLLQLSIVLTGLLFTSSCTKTESDFSTPAQETITVAASTLNTATGTAVTFLVTSSLNSTDVTAASKIYVNGTLITGSSFTFNEPGTFAVYATKGTLNSNVISVEVVTVTTGYKHKVLVEEYSGTWCGNCPRILYGVDLLHQQTDNAIVVGIHLFNGDPFIIPDGNDLAANQGVTGVPTGNINRTVSWNGPQYENVSQVINTIQPSASAGLAINSTLTGNTISITIKAGFAQAVAGNTKLTVYLVEDNLLYTQRNYSSNLYGGAANIPQFEYDGVLRKVVTAVTGDAISSAAGIAENNYTLDIPSSISNTANARIVAFVTDASGTALNVQSAVVGENKLFETL